MATTPKDIMEQRTKAATGGDGETLLSLFTISEVVCG